MSANFYSPISAQQAGEIFKKSRLIKEDFIGYIYQEIRRYSENYLTSLKVTFPAYLNEEDRASILNTLKGKGYLVHREPGYYSIDIYWGHTCYNNS